MVVTKTVHWGNTGTEPVSGVDDDYAVNEQPVAEWDNWFNKATETDIAALITALQNTTTGHDHDGANSKTVDVDGADVINTPAGTISATDVQAAITELDSKSSSGNYTANATANRAIPHGLSSPPKVVLITNASNISFSILVPATIIRNDNSAANAVTAVDSTNFYVGNAASYANSANQSGVHYWVAIA